MTSARTGPWLRRFWLGLLPAMAGVVWAGEEESLNPPLDLLSASVRVVGVLLVFLAIALLASRMARRLHPSLGSGPIQLLGGRTIAPGVGVRLVRVGGRCLLLGFTREQITLLAEINPDELSASERVAP